MKPSEIVTEWHDAIGCASDHANEPWKLRVQAAGMSLATDYEASLSVLRDSLDRPLVERIAILTDRANNEARLAVALRNKLYEVAGADIASAIE